jgi:hypothetical protein
MINGYKLHKKKINLMMMMHSSVLPPTSSLLEGEGSSLCIICHEDVVTRSTTRHHCGCVYIAHSTCEKSMAQITNIGCCYCRKGESFVSTESATSERTYLTTIRLIITGLFVDVPAAFTVACVMILLENVTDTL